MGCGGVLVIGFFGALGVVADGLTPLATRELDRSTSVAATSVAATSVAATSVAATSVAATSVAATFFFLLDWTEVAVCFLTAALVPRPVDGVSDFVFRVGFMVSFHRLFCLTAGQNLEARRVVVPGANPTRQGNSPVCPAHPAKRFRGGDPSR